MNKRTIISCVILFTLICLSVLFSIVVPELWTKYLSHWMIPSTVAVIMTLLVGLVLMDGLFELDDALVITLRKPKLKIEIRKYLVWAFLIVCFVSIVLELVQFFISHSTVDWLDPLLVIIGAIAGIIIHIIGSKVLMKRVEFELERWEDNVL